MARRNRPRRSRRMISRRYDSDVCFLPEMAGVARITAHPLKTIFRNMDAAPWAREDKEIFNPNDPLLHAIAEGRRRA